MVLICVAGFLALSINVLVVFVLLQTPKPLRFGRRGWDGAWLLSALVVALALAAVGIALFANMQSK